METKKFSFKFLFSFLVHRREETRKEMAKNSASKFLDAECRCCVTSFRWNSTTGRKKKFWRKFNFWHPSGLVSDFTGGFLFSALMEKRLVLCDGWGELGGEFVGMWPVMEVEGRHWEGFWRSCSEFNEAFGGLMETFLWIDHYKIDHKKTNYRKDL